MRWVLVMAHDSDGANDLIKKEKVIKGFGLQVTFKVLSLKSSRVNLRFECFVNKSCNLFWFLLLYTVHYIKYIKIY